jgi:hypothetical protein
VYNFYTADETQSYTEGCMNFSLIKSQELIALLREVSDTSTKVKTETINLLFDQSKFRWRTPLQATGYVRATARNSVKEDNKT